ncbi:MAG: competence/damage-inducible protein A [Roseinatronobacter sp.]|nr:MAG: competence/damage-inducible protein A [Roseinatronobacter sp.]
MSNPTAAMLVIGDEILSGRTRDANMHYLAGQLAPRGIDLCEVRIVTDQHDRIVAALNALRAEYDHVFTSGGIGPTHDDITADAVAAAFGVGVDIRDDARAILAEHYTRTGLELNAARLRMARIPDGASLIENPVSSAPGFSIGNVHVMAGVPAVFQAMVAALLPGLAAGAALYAQNLTIPRGEGEIAADLKALAEGFPELSIGCYPFQRDGAFGATVVVRGEDKTRVDAALVKLAALFPEAVA